MIPELGHYALVLALALGLIQSIVPIVGAATRDAGLMRLASSTAVIQRKERGAWWSWGRRRNSLRR